MRMPQSTLTGVAAAMFAAGVIALLAALYRDAERGGPLLWLGIALLIATIVCWFLAAKAGDA